jgi:hypothetical protein
MYCYLLDGFDFAEKYINELKKKDIKIGAITNNNKFENCIDTHE